MTLKEYETQLALGTIDFRQAANKTKSGVVLQDIISRTDEVVTLLTVAINPKVNIYTLTLLATYPKAATDVIAACAWHPRVTLNILDRWMKYRTIAGIAAVRQRVRILQLASGVPYNEALIVQESSDMGDESNPWKRLQPPQTFQEYVTWTSTGNNTAIKLYKTAFSFSDDGVNPTYYSYTHTPTAHISSKVSS